MRKVTFALTPQVHMFNSGGLSPLPASPAPLATSATWQALGAAATPSASHGLCLGLGGSSSPVAGQACRHTFWAPSAAPSNWASSAAPAATSAPTPWPAPAAPLSIRAPTWPQPALTAAEYAAVTVPAAEAARYAAACAAAAQPWSDAASRAQEALLRQNALAAARLQYLASLPALPPSP